MDIKFVVLLAVLFLFVLLPQSKWPLILSSENLRVFLIILIVVPSISLIEERFGGDLARILNERVSGIVKASLIGLITPGPIYVIFPLAGKLKEKKVKPSILIPLITGQSSIGPIRLFIEAGIFGLPFITARLIGAFLISILSGILTVPLDEKI